MSKYKQYLLTGNRRPVFIEGARTAFVKSFGAFQDSDTLEMYSRAVDGLLRKLDLPASDIDEISCGVVIPQTKNPNVARDTAINLGLPDHIHGYTLNRACTSSLQTIADSSRTILAGQPTVALAGGVECLSDVPITYSKAARKLLIKLSKARSLSQKISLLSQVSAKDWIPKSPELAEPLTGYTMGQHAEMMAKINSISREEQDAFAHQSHQKAAIAQEKGYLAQEIVPLWQPPKFVDCVQEDNLIRKDTTLEGLAKLRPAFDRKWGTISAGNASPLTDGAAVCLIADEQRAKDLGLKPKSLIRDFLFLAVQPNPQLLIGPALAIPLLLKRNKLSLQDIDRFEVHEAFAAQVLTCLKLMDSPAFMEEKLGESKAFGRIPDDKLNVNGGALAIGHPFGATGARLVMSLSNELIRSNKQFGVIAICAAGGMAGAMLIERLG